MSATSSSGTIKIGDNMTEAEKFFSACQLLIRSGVTGFTVTPELYVALFEYVQGCNDNLGLHPPSCGNPYKDILKQPPVRFRNAPFKLDKEYK
jgi:hypothetical protein